MEQHGRQVFDVLDKPLSLVTKFIFSLANRSSSGSHGGGPDGHHSPSPSTHSPITSNPLVPAFLLLTVGLLLVTVTPLGTWLAAEGSSTTLNEIFSFSRKKQTHSLPKLGEKVSVWAKKQSGFYYCLGGTLFGNKPGKIMTQSEALMSGFQPAGGKYCANRQPTVASASSGLTSSEEQQPAAAEVSSVSAKEVSVPLPAVQTDSPKGQKSVTVWAMTEFATYYCQGETLFGSQPGRLMTQSDAIKAGYQPSDTRCTNDTPNQASAGFLALGSQQPLTPGVSSANEEDMSVLSPLGQHDSQVASNNVSVWVIKELGFYYCQGDVLFGHKPGQLMSQSEALTAGYQPSDSRCTKAR